MRKYSKEEIDTLWEQAYFKANSASQQASGIWLFLLFLLVPIALFGFSTSLFIAWVPFSLSSFLFANHVRVIWQKGESSETPARIAIVRGQILGILGLYIFWLMSIIFLFRYPNVSDTYVDKSLPIVIMVIAYAITIPIAWSWGKRQTQMLLEKDRIISVKGLNIFGGWVQVYFVTMSLLLGGAMVFLLPTLGIRYAFIAALTFPGIGLMMFMATFANVHLLWAVYQIGLENSPYQKGLKDVEKQLKEQRKAKRFEPTVLPIWCEVCDAQGEVTIHDNIGDHYVICKECGTETSQIWCEDEEVGGQFVSDIHEHPTEYICRFCKKIHQLPADFYEKPVTLELIEEPRNKRK